MTATSDLAALIRGVCERPDDDLLRAIVADHYRDCGNEEMADFIERQIANPKLVETCQGDRSVGQPCPFDRGGQTADYVFCPTCQELIASGFPERLCGEDGYKITRGFVSAITLGTATFLRHAGEIFGGERAQPIERVMLSDREPFLAIAGPRVYSWFVQPDHTDANSPTWGRFRRNQMDRALVPQELVECGLPLTAFGSSELARAALSAACCAYGRKLAGLPALGDV